jgi:hypothetical protein
LLNRKTITTALHPLAWGFAGTALVCAALFASSKPDQASPEKVGWIEGEAIAVQGPMTAEMAHGQPKTVLLSGSDVRVKSGQARINLVEGGQLSICGPAHFSVLKAAGSLTVALDSGTIHAHIEREPVLTIYTAQIQAKPITIAGNPQDLLVGFEPAGAMCVRATSGAVRIEQQLTGQNVIVPQGADVLVPNGQLENLRSGTAHCSCELQLAKSPPAPENVRPSGSDVPKQGETTVSNSTSARPSDPPDNNAPIYQVFMPPLTYDAKAKVQPDIDPHLLVLIRRVRVRPTLIFQGRVEGDPIVAANSTSEQDKAAAPPSAAKPIPQSSPADPQANESVLGRVRAFFHRLWTRTSASATIH